jgi:hypothetical protein
VKAVGESREFVRDAEARCFGSRVEEHLLVPCARRASAASRVNGLVNVLEEPSAQREQLVVKAHDIPAVERL